MKLAILVPVYNCEPVIDQVVDDILAHAELPVFIVDDGSTPSVKLKVDNSKLHLLRLEKNSGKGMAMQHGFNYCAQLGFTHVLAMDGDGQHLAENISKFVSVFEENPHALVVGCREFKEGVPGISHFGRSFSNFWVRYQTGVSVDDTQSGMRLYPLKELVGVNYFTKRYDFEIEVLVRSIWRGVPVEQVSISVFYPDESVRISHFDKFRDNFRITLLNILLIAYSLLFRKQTMSPIRIILLGVSGYLVSLIPSIPLSLFLGIFMCVVFRFNVIFMLLLVGLLKFI